MDAHDMKVVATITEADFDSRTWQCLRQWAIFTGHELQTWQQWAVALDLLKAEPFGRGGVFTDRAHQVRTLGTIEKLVAECAAHEKYCLQS